MTRRMLVAEDEEPVRAALARLLVAAGWEVEAVPDGEAALAALRRAPPDAAVIDAMLAGRDGFDLCRAVREDCVLARIRLVLTSARGRAIDREKALALGADAMLTKPFSFADLETALRSGDRAGEGAR